MLHHEVVHPNRSAKLPNFEIFYNFEGKSRVRSDCGRSGQREAISSELRVEKVTSSAKVVSKARDKRAARDNSEEITVREYGEVKQRPARSGLQRQF